MELHDVYEAVSRSVVAIAIKLPQSADGFRMPPILGTGFVVGDGLVATNDHVIRAAEALHRERNMPEGEWPVTAILFFAVPGKGLAHLHMEIRGVWILSRFQPQGPYYGPPTPDLGFFHVNMRGMPALQLADDLECIVPGTRVATAGFPMGTDALAAPGYIHQFTPTLQEGVVSAVLPFPCSHPHALMLNMMTQGGASGSPIFLQDRPEVAGVLYAGLTETYFLDIQSTRVPYRVPTNFTYCVTGHYLRRAIEEILAKPELRLPDDSPSFADVAEQARRLEIPAAVNAGALSGRSAEGGIGR